MSEKKKEKKSKGDKEEKEEKIKSPKDDSKPKKEKDSSEKKDGEKKSKDGEKKGAGKDGDKKEKGKDGDKKGASKDGVEKQEVATLPVNPDAPPALDADGNPIVAKPDPPPTFAELWYDDPVEGVEAQRLALELRSRIENRALGIREYLEQAIVPLLLQGLQHMVLERPTNAAEYLAAFLLKNNPLKDTKFVEPPKLAPATVAPPPPVEPPKCSCCQVHCPPPPDFYRKNDTPAKDAAKTNGTPGPEAALTKAASN